LELLYNKSDDTAVIKFQLAKVGRYDLFESFTSNSQITSFVEEKIDSEGLETRGGGDGALGMANERCGSDAIELRLRSEGYLVIGFLSSLPYVALFYST